VQGEGRRYRAGDHHDVGFSDWSFGELVLAAVRCEKPERAAGALQQLAARADDCESEWALGIEARSRALLSEARTPTAATARRSTGSAGPASA
jgi:hypothetical protein